MFHLIYFCTFCIFIYFVYFVYFVYIKTDCLGNYPFINTYTVTVKGYAAKIRLRAQSCAETCAAPRKAVCSTLATLAQFVRNTYAMRFQQFRNCSQHARTSVITLYTYMYIYICVYIYIHIL